MTRETEVTGDAWVPRRSGRTPLRVATVPAQPLCRPQYLLYNTKLLKLGLALALALAQVQAPPPPADLFPPATSGPAKHRSGTLPASSLHPSRSPAPSSPTLFPRRSSSPALPLFLSRSRAAAPGRTGAPLRARAAPPAPSSLLAAAGGVAGQSPGSVAAAGPLDRRSRQRGRRCSAAPGGDAAGRWWLGVLGSARLGAQSGAARRARSSAGWRGSGGGWARPSADLIVRSATRTIVRSVTF
ncbi:translation initiation factor IF-2 [Triticum aestivum]|uniref:translation initiation factor IF-2 n=1 Tax=Triticum aestivum TaxID=4565 RepID=UPI001D026F0F|nr:translation initiation factor IF-2-like [Triticum aestivum]